MNFDRNTVIGFIVLAILFIGYFYYISKEQSTYRKQKAIQDSIANINRPKPDTSTLKGDSVSVQEQQAVTASGEFKNAATGTERILTVENDVLRISFTNKGAQPRLVELKNYKDQDGKPVRLASSAFDKIDYQINTAENQSAGIADLYFSPGVIRKNGDSTVVSFTLASDSAGPSIVHEFVIRKDDYMVDFNIRMNGADKLLEKEVLNLQWQYESVKQEKDLLYERNNTQVSYVEDGEFDYHTVGRRRTDVEFDKPVEWVAMRQRFFNGILVAKNNFSGGKIEWTLPNDTAVVVQSTALLRLDAAGTNMNIPLSFFYGPSDFDILKKYNKEMGKIVNLGQGIYAFVRPINKYIILPVFGFLKSSVGSYGIAILLLTFVIRLLISPLTYTSYLSGAKMKALRPEIQKLKDKFGKDQQQMSMEQMKLFREAGVNPLGGCIPALLQIPIFFALYSFFNSSVLLRGENFLWASDLSAYDSVVEFSFNIPLYGSHISLFTITACITSFFISLYSMSTTPDQSNPVLKYMPYVFPFFLLFIFNRLPAALTWYYTVSNLITLGLQFVIQTYIIDHDKILAKIEENRKKPKTRSKWQERLEQMQEQQKKMKTIQQKGRR